MEEINIIIAVISFLLLSLGLIKKYLELSVFSEPLIALLSGILIGPEFLGLTDPGSWEHPVDILHQSTRFTLSLALMAAALRLPPNFIRKNARPFSVLVLGGMLLMLIFASLFFFVAGFTFPESLLIGAILAPTDPVLATTIVSGFYADRHVPAHMRNMITAESASNDGLAYPFVLLPLVFLSGGKSSFGSWFLDILVVENIGAIILGALTGYLTGTVFLYFDKRKALEIKTLSAVTLSLSFLITASFPIFNLNGIIGVFAAGIIFRILMEEDIGARHERVQSMMERIFIVPVFVLLGMMIPWREWANMGPLIWIITPFVIIFRRLPGLFFLKPFIRIFSLKDVFFAGWFGPVGIAALFYVILVKADYPGYENLWPIVTYAICCSTVLYAFSAYPLTRYFYARHKEPGVAERFRSERSHLEGY